MLEKATNLISEIEVKVRFSETDAMGIVWHGNYIKYMEDGREDWGDKYNMSYQDVYSHGLVTPIVKNTLNHKRTLKFGDIAIVRTKFINTPASKLIYAYQIFRKSDMQMVLEAKTVQVFTDENENLILNAPDWFTNWKSKHGL